MHQPSTRHWAFIGVFVLLASTLGFSVYGLIGDPTSTDVDGATAHDGMTARFGAIGPIGLSLTEQPKIVHEPPFPLEEGKVPTKSDALDFAARYSRFIARGTEGLDKLADEGHLAGSGTTTDPYVLDRFYVDGDLTIESTHRSIVIKNGYVNGQLSLNYIGERVYVHHVYAKDLRVNENVERSGRNTGGFFHDNEFGFVGQIRHFTGEFRDNQIGPIPEGIVRDYLSDNGAATVADGVVFNFDGFHGAAVHDNRFVGQVDIKLHGHNHGDCFTCPIHDHADPDQLAFDEEVAAQHEWHDEDEGNMSLQEAMGFRTRHSVRYHSLLFENNRIEVPKGSAFALRYNDQNHAGDDRTAASEPSRFLEDPHVHYQDITLRGNELFGGPLRLQTFNARDEQHVTKNLGILRIEQNKVEVAYQRSTESNERPLLGFDLRNADGIQLLVSGNSVRFIEADDGMPLGTLRSVGTKAPTLIGFRLQTFAVGEIFIVGNSVNRGDAGVFAHDFADAVYWELRDNTFQTDTPWRGERVAHGPGERGGDGA